MKLAEKPKIECLLPKLLLAFGVSRRMALEVVFMSLHLSSRLARLRHTIFLQPLPD
jgi:hypothetical protein